MSTIAKRRSIFSVLFSSDIDVEDYKKVKLPEVLKKAQESIDETTILQGFNSKGKSSKNVFAKKFDSRTEAVLEEMRKQSPSKLKEDKEDRERD